MESSTFPPTDSMRTFGARVWVSEEDHASLMALAERLAQARHTLLKRWGVQGEGLATVKRELMARFGLSSRQFNGIRVEVQQEVAAWRGRTLYLKTQAEHRLTDLKDRVRRTESAIKKQTRTRDSLARQRGRTSRRVQRKMERAWAAAAAAGRQKTIRPSIASSPTPVQARLRSKAKAKRPPPPTVAELTENWQQAREKLARLRSKLHRLKLQVSAQEARLTQLARALEGPPQVCFGGTRTLATAQRKLDRALGALNAATNAHQSQDPALTKLGGVLSVARQAKLERRVAAARAEIESWKARRTTRFLCVGSKDEPAGNASAIYDPVGYTLSVALLPQSGEIRLPRLVLALGKKAFTRNRGQETLQAALDDSRAYQVQQLGHAKDRRHRHAVCRAALRGMVYQPLRGAETSLGSPMAGGAWAGRESSPLWSRLTIPVFQAASAVSAPTTAAPATAGTGGAITWRFRADPEHDDPVKGRAWQVYATVAVPAAPIRTSRLIGGLGVDVNGDHLACTLVDRFGNATRTWSLPFPAAREGLSAGQARVLVESTVLMLCREAQRHQVPLVIEALDFQRKKASLRALGPEMARLLSGMAYRQFETALVSRAVKDGVEVITVNPAFTSQIGKLKYLRQRPSLTIHQAAAWVIARRGLSYTERVPFPLIATGPARNQPRSRWNRWRHVEVSEPEAPPAVYGSISVAQAFARGAPTMGPPH